MTRMVNRPDTTQTGRQSKPTLQNLPLLFDRENMLFEMDKVQTYLNEWNQKIWELHLFE